MGIATRYGLQGLGIESWCERYVFCTSPDSSYGQPSLLYSGYRVHFHGVKRPEPVSYGLLLGEILGLSSMVSLASITCAAWARVQILIGQKFMTSECPDCSEAHPAHCLKLFLGSKASGA